MSELTFFSPFITAPLLRGMDRVVVTPQGQTPPPMGKSFEETPENRRRRMKTSEKFVVDTQSTYRLIHLLRNILTLCC